MQIEVGNRQRNWKRALDEPLDIFRRCCAIEICIESNAYEVRGYARSRRIRKRWTSTWRRAVIIPKIVSRNPAAATHINANQQSQAVQIQSTSSGGGTGDHISSELALHRPLNLVYDARYADVTDAARFIDNAMPMTVRIPPTRLVVIAEERDARDLLRCRQMHGSAVMADNEFALP